MKEKKKKKTISALEEVPLESLPAKQFSLLQESLDLFTTNGHIGYFRITRDGELLEFNPAMTHMLGIIVEAKLPHISNRLKKILLGVVKPNEIVIRLEKEIPLSNKKVIQLLLSAKSVFIKGKEIIIGLAEDITTSNKITEKLDINRTNLNILIDSINNPAWSLDKDGCLLAFNNIFYDYFILRFGQNPEIGMSVFKTLAPEDVSDWKTLFERAIEGKKLVTETSFKIKGVDHYYELIVNPIYDNNHIVIATAFICHDITEHKTTENVLLKSTTHLQALIDNIPNQIWLKDVNGKIIIANQSFLDFFNIKAEFLRKSEIPAALRKSKFWNYIVKDSDILASGAKLTEEKSFIINKETRWFEIHKTPIYDDKFELIGSTGMARHNKP